MFSTSNNCWLLHTVGTVGNVAPVGIASEITRMSPGNYSSCVYGSHRELREVPQAPAVLAFMAAAETTRSDPGNHWTLRTREPYAGRSGVSSCLSRGNMSSI
jgi:hypothetical protein